MLLSRLGSNMPSIIIKRAAFPRRRDGQITGSQTSIRRANLPERF
jgi:hypothetical protein